MTELQEKLIESCVLFVQKTLQNAEAGHDWFHIERVWKNARQILKYEKGADELVVTLGVLLHDIADGKFHDGDEEIGPRLAANFLKQQDVSDMVIDEVIYIIRNVSFKNEFLRSEKTSNKSRALGIVQDADRLDAMGAIGIARAFHYGGYKNHALYDPAIKPAQYSDPEKYRKSTAPTINHFYEKLLFLKDRMNTTEGKRMAGLRHEFMKSYLKQFFAEWEGIS